MIIEISDTYYDFEFKASKSGITFRDNNNSNSPYTLKPDTLACNTKSVKINYVWFNDTLGLNKYEWTWGDRMSTKQFPEIIFDKEGSYTVKLKITKTDNKTETYEQLIVIPECVSNLEKIDSLPDSNYELNVFPNPTNSNLTVLIKESSDYSCVILDACGRFIKKEKFSGKLIEINCSDISTGLYFIKVYNNTVSYNSKFIKQ